MDGKFKSRVGRPLPQSLGRPVGVIPVDQLPIKMRRTFQRSGSHKPVVLGRGGAIGGIGSPVRGTITNENVQIPQKSGESHDEFTDDGIKFINVPKSTKTVNAKADTTKNHTLLNHGSSKDNVCDSSRSTKSNSSRAGRSRPDSSSSGVQSSHGARTGSSKSGVRGGSAKGSKSDSSVVTDQHESSTATEEKPAKTIDPQQILEMSLENKYENVYEINLHATELTHIANLEKFKKVRVLDLSCNYLEKIEKLEINSDLRELKLYDNRIKAVERLQYCKELCSIQLQHNRIKQIGKGLNGLTKLKSLRIDCNKLLKIEASELSCCPQLTTVDISYNMIDSLSALNYLPNLEEVIAAGNRLRSVELSRCKRLSEVDLSHNRITDLSGLKGLPNIQIVNVSSNNLTTLKSLGKSRSLQELHVSDNKLSELSYFSTYFPRLEILNVSCNCVSDFDEVLTLESLEEFAELFIAGNPFSDVGSDHCHYMAEVQSCLPKLEILDGAHIKRTTQKGAPLMRPMSASTIISVRQVETLMKSSDDEMKSLERSIMDNMIAAWAADAAGMLGFHAASILVVCWQDAANRFESLREVCETLPEQPPDSARKTESTETRKSISRQRIQQALQFAADNFNDV